MWRCQSREPVFRLSRGDDNVGAQQGYVQAYRARAGDQGFLIAQRRRDDIEYESGMEVDAKLLELAKELHASIMTTDYNLNRVAQIEGILVLNVNELENSVKHVVLPGEDMRLMIVQEGKEVGQGVGFLEDGTMLVVDSGSVYVNQDMYVVATRVLQTATGRIIFAQPKRS